MIVVYALAAALGLGVLWLGTNLRVVKNSNEASFSDSVACKQGFAHRY